MSCPKCGSREVDGGTEHGSTYDFVCRACGNRFDCVDTSEAEEDSQPVRVQPGREEGQP
jgi:transcription elongation factor Elf1